MRIMKSLFAALLLLLSTSAVFAQAKPEEHRTVSQIEDRLVSSVEGEFVPAADAMPEDKYSFAPTNGEFKGVRSFAHGRRSDSGTKASGRTWRRKWSRLND